MCPEVGRGRDANRFPVGSGNQQMAHAMLPQQRVARPEVEIVRGGDDRVGHHAGQGCFGRCPLMHQADQIPFGQDAGNVASLHDDQRRDAPVHHLCGGGSELTVRRGGDDPPAHDVL